MLDKEQQYLEPCRLADNFYHIGFKDGPSYLLETSCGDVLIDTAFPQTYDYLIENLHKIGKDEKNIKHIVHTHGHYDHVGATAKLVKLSGAKTYIGAPDLDAVLGKNDRLCNEAFGETEYEPFVPDVLLYDGDAVSFGDTDMRFVMTPGHTVGTLSLFFDVNVDGKPYKAGLFGGAGLNTLQSEYLKAHSLTEQMRELFVRSIDRIIDEPVEFHVGNHLYNFNYYEKLEKLGREDGNPFLKYNTYVSFLKDRRSAALELIEKSKQI